jgi:putative methyltransferase (TIGR04325 family)
MIVTNNITETKPFHIWEGIYDSYQAAAAAAIGPGFGGEVYHKRSLAAAHECLASLKSGKPIPQFHKQRSTLLPLVVAMILSNNKMIRVLDFGGGLGIGYMTLVESTPDDLKRIDYTIVEVPEVCKVGVDLVEGPRYLSTLPPSHFFDLIHAASSLQYIEHWQDLIEKFASLNPKYILLSDIFAGHISSFVTLQNYYESRIPHWFLNLQELLNVFDKYGYRLIMQSYVTSRRLNVNDTLPMDNFPEIYRLPQSLHLLLQVKQ